MPKGELPFASSQLPAPLIPPGEGTRPSVRIWNPGTGDWHLLTV